MNNLSTSHLVNPDLEKSLPLGQLSLLRKVADAAAVRHLPLYLVGGFVRDLLLGSPATDFDLVVEGDAISLARGLVEQYGGKVTVHARFGTAQWFQDVPGRHPLDFISTRSETYKHPAALPTVMPGSLKDDLARRDFSINTLAIRLDGDHWGELRDDMGGLKDLKQGIVRVLHPLSFRDDPTRLYRAVRYEQRYGFHIGPETMSIVPEAKGLVDLLSAERVRHELDLILGEEKAVSMVDRLAELDLLRPVHPVLKWNKKTHQRFLKGLNSFAEVPLKSKPAILDRCFLGWHFWLMGIDLNDLKSLEQRLHFRAILYNSLEAASGLSATLPSYAGIKPSQCVSKLDEMPIPAAYAVFMTARDGKVRQSLYNYLETWRHVKPKTNGHDLEKRGLIPGPRYQQILQQLRNAWLDGDVNSEEEEIKLLDELVIPAE
jgi:tRNA nucleotidyltransferase (CCA-adding enzyme)